MYGRNSIGPNTDLSKTPDFISCIGEILSLIEIYCFRFNK